MLRKTLGILGGMGPRATAYFYSQLVDRTLAEKDWEHLHIVIDSNVRIPSRTRAVKYREWSPVDRIRRACYNLLNIGCDYIAVPCNSAHYFYDDVVEGYHLPWINMLEVIAGKLKDFNRVLILGGYVTAMKRTYDRHMSNAVYLPGSDNEVVFDLIERIKREDVDALVYRHWLNNVIEKSRADCVLLACTELPLVLRQSHYVGVPLVDGNALYIDELLRLGGGRSRYEQHGGRVLEDTSRVSTGTL